MPYDCSVFTYHDMPSWCAFLLGVLLFFSVIFYLSNGRYKISYIDSLFNCVSAMAVCGLATVDLSSLTPWQQVILFMQMCIGSPVRVGR